MKQKIVVAWSGGKDSAMALWRLQGDERYQVVGLLTTLTEDYDRIQMHGVRRVLLVAQAEALGLPLIDWMNDSPLLLIVFVNGFVGASMGMIIFTSAIRAIPDHLFHAARADGAGGLAIVRHVILPSIRWPLSFVTIYQTLSLLVSFEYIWLVTNGGPFYDTMVYALYVYKRAFESGFYAYGAAMALVLVAVGAVAALAMWRFMDMRALMQRPRIEVH